MPLYYSFNLEICKFNLSLFFSALFNSSNMLFSTAFFFISSSLVILCSSCRLFIVSILFCLSSSSEFTSWFKCLILSPLFIINDSIVFLFELFLLISCAVQTIHFCCSIDCTISSISSLYSLISEFNDSNFSISLLYISSQETFS